MDELIRELEELRDEARRASKTVGERTPSGYVLAGQASMAATILGLAREAKRRMADRELGPVEGPIVLHGTMSQAGSP